MSSWALSDAFEYLCYGYTVIIDIFTLYSAGIDFSQLKSGVYKVYPRAAKVNSYISK